jgi:hypothetical protein
MPGVKVPGHPLHLFLILRMYGTQNVFIAWFLVKQRANCIFTLLIHHRNM